MAALWFGGRVEHDSIRAPPPWMDSILNFIVANINYSQVYMICILGHYSTRQYLKELRVGNMMFRFVSLAACLR